MSTTRTRRSRRTVAVLAVCLVALTGCSTLKAGSAATVDQTQLSQADVADLVAEVDTTVADAELESAVPANQVPLQIVGLWVDAQLTKALANAEDVSVTQGELDTYLERWDEEARAQIVAENAVPDSLLDGAVETFLLKEDLATQLAPDGTPEEQAQALGEALAATADEVGISVNPRYGSWDESIPGVVPRSEDRLSSLDAPAEEVIDPNVPPAQ